MIEQETEHSDALGSLVPMVIAPLLCICMGILLYRSSTSRGRHQDSRVSADDDGSPTSGSHRPGRPAGAWVLTGTAKILLVAITAFASITVVCNPRSCCLPRASTVRCRRCVFRRRPLPCPLPRGVFGPQVAPKR